MRIGPFGLPELLFIAVLILIFFAPRRLGKLGRRMGSSLNSAFRGVKALSSSNTGKERS